MNVFKLLTPLRIKGTYIYPKTVASQVQMDDDQEKKLPAVLDEKVNTSDILTVEEYEASSPKPTDAELEQTPASALDTVKLNQHLVNKGTFAELFGRSSREDAFTNIDLNDSIENYERIMFTCESSSNAQTDAICELPSAFFKTRYNSASLHLAIYSSKLAAQVYYVNDTRMCIKTTNSYRIHAFGIK